MGDASASANVSKRTMSIGSFVGHSGDEAYYQAHEPITHQSMQSIEPRLLRRAFVS